MDDFAKAREKGMEIFEDWLRGRFPQAEIRYVGNGTWSFFKWRVRTEGGEAPLHIGATERVLADHEILKERLADLDRHGWLKDAGTRERWVQVNVVGIAEKTPDLW